MMPDSAGPDDDLRAALTGVRGLILDADGVIVFRNAVIAGAPEGLARLAAAGIPFRVVTNFTGSHRETLAARFRADGLDVDPARIITGASAAAAWTARAHPGEPLYVLAPPDALREFAGQRLLTADEARRPGATAGAVVIGDAGSDLRFDDLDVAFGLARAGAELLAMHRNPWWLTVRGVTLDSGALVVGLEFALGRRAVTVGKPSPVVFRQAAAGLASDLGLRRLPAPAIAMVGDDPLADLAPAHRLGMRTVLVLTGKTGPGDADAAFTRLRFRPDAVAPSIREVARALG